MATIGLSPSGFANGFLNVRSRLPPERTSIEASAVSAVASTNSLTSEIGRGAVALTGGLSNASAGSSYGVPETGDDSCVDVATTMASGIQRPAPMSRAKGADSAGFFSSFRLYGLKGTCRSSGRIGQAGVDVFSVLLQPIWSAGDSQRQKSAPMPICWSPAGQPGTAYSVAITRNSRKVCP